MATYVFCISKARIMRTSRALLAHPGGVALPAALFKGIATIQPNSECWNVIIGVTLGKTAVLLFAFVTSRGHRKQVTRGSIFGGTSMLLRTHQHLVLNSFLAQTI